MTTSLSSSRIIQKPFRDDTNFLRVRNLLIDTYPITPTGFNWEVRRWDGWRFYSENPAWNPEWKDVVRLWETEDRQLVGAVHPEGTGDAHLELHPAYRHIEREMVEWAEEHLSTRSGDGKKLRIFVFEYDAPRRRLLEERGYEKTDSGGFQHRMRLGNINPERFPLADGYTLRTTRPDDDADCQRIADLLNAAFNRDFHRAGEFRTFTSNAPSFRDGLDLVAVAPDGSFASYVGTPYDDVNQIGIFEPVCTHPAHLRKGLARTLMTEALCRLKTIGATDVYVGTGDKEAANRLYESVGFAEAYKGYEWFKQL